MELTDFCAKTCVVLAQQPSVILFKSKQYNPLSFHQILKWLQVCSVANSDLNSSLNNLSKLDLDLDLSQLIMKLQTTFLGQTSTFWFGDLDLISSKKKRSDLISFLQSYQGPHQIIGCIGEQDQFVAGTGSVLVVVPELYTSEIVRKISFLYQEHKPEVAAYFFGRLYRVKKEYTLEQLCLLHSYVGLIGKSIDLFFDAWLEQLVISDVSLFYLGQLFFEKRADEFFVQWHQVRPYYSDQFWTAFFSEQLFKAYFYVAAQGRVPPEQKQMTYGLPFSFLKHDWRLYQSSQLQQAHQQLYEVDIALKTGGTVYRFDLFFAKFFAG